MDVMVTIPDGTQLDGAVVELYLREDWRTTSGPAYAAEIRIPAPQK
jgi:hypothetical protein